MSSAILYLAIIAIWLCVLIPRWLKRDSARGAVVAPDTAVPAETPATTAADGEETDTADDGAPRVTEPGDAAPAPTQPTAPTAQAVPAPPLSAEEARRRILTGRRRLLGMLILLEIAAIALAVVGLAAMWVIIPPTIMLVGYLLLLREAAHADAERARREEEAARAREHATAASPAAPQAPAARYEDPPPGRDFAPGLAGKYTTSTAEVIDISEGPDEDFRDEYQATKLRAVGD